MGVSVKRIVVTGMGIVSPLGCGVQHVWQSLLAGKSGITRLSEQLVADIPCKVAGQVPSIDSDPLHGFDPLATIPAKERKKMDRFIEFALVAAREALAQAGWSPASEAEQERTATVIATGIGGFSEIANAVHTTDERGPRRLSPFTIPLSGQPGRRACVYRPRLPGPHRRAGHRLRSGRPGHRRCGADDPQRRGGYCPLRRRGSGNSSR
jgi:3-oxoacyl-[acyl-carrier-protein] synthase II